MSRQPRERPHRLPRESYQGRHNVVFTSCLLHRNSLFTNDRPTIRFAEILLEEAEKQGCAVTLACFMPDHVHALFQGLRDDSDPLAAFDRFKLRSAVILDRFHRPYKWQKDYYDHVVRYGDDWITQACYICLNHVRQGLVEDAYDYSYFFSSLGDRKAVLDQVFWEG